MAIDATLLSDRAHVAELLQLAYVEALQFLESVESRPVNGNWPRSESRSLPVYGLGAQKTLELFRQTFGAGITGSAGPRYFGFVTGGSTPAAIMGDWLTSAFDQNAADKSSAVATQIEADTIEMLRSLLGLPSAFAGQFVSGATMSNFVGLAIGRQWWGERLGMDVARTGLFGLPKLVVLSGSPHSSVYKSLSMLGVGRDNLTQIATLSDREAVDIQALEQALAAQAGQPCIVVANAGVVNTVDFDDIAAIASLKRNFDFYLHVDAAFGGFAACSPRYQHLVSGWEKADSITVDAHKWLNVPYDSAMQFTQHTDLQMKVFQNSGAAYLGMPNSADAFHLTPENSRRMRALPAWFTLVAYGAAGYRQIVESNCACAALFGEHIAASTSFELLAPVRMNVVTFTLREPASAERVAEFLRRLRDDGSAFLTPTTYMGKPAMRAAFSNWRTTIADVETTWTAMHTIADLL